MTDPDTIVERYLAAWNERVPEARLALVAATFSHDASYVDPLTSGHGIEGLDAMIAAAQEQFPGLSFRLAGEPDAHGDRLRFSWHLAADGGPAVAGGTDFAVLAEDGRMCSVTGFLDPVG